MAPLFLRLGQHVLDTEAKVLMLGLSIDQHPSSEARAAAAAATGQQQVDTATVHPTTAAVAALRVSTAADSTGEPEVVVVSVVPPEDPSAHQLARDVTLDVSLTAGPGTKPEFSVSSSSPGRVALTPLSPALARLAAHSADRCQALLADGTRYPLARAERRWCLPRLEHHVVLHDEELAARKPWHEDTTVGLGYMGRTVGGNIAAYNALQASLALRALITCALYVADNDPGHKAFERATVRNRSNIAAHLAGCGSDGAGRLAISSFVPAFVAAAAAREAAPRARASRLATLTLDPAVVRAHLWVPGAPASTVSGLFAGPTAAWIMNDSVVAAVRGFGDLPPLVRKREVAWEELAEETKPWEEVEWTGWDAPQAEGVSVGFW